MRVGVVKELKPAERRVALTPAGALALGRDGHEVLVESSAGVGCGFEDAAYAATGARITCDAAEVWRSADLLLKVKEPIEAEYDWLRPDLTLFAFLHLAPNPGLTDALVRSGATAIAYETVEDERGLLPLLIPMSEIAGRLAAQVAAYHLQAPLGGSGVLIGGAPGVTPARVVVIGGGIAGTSAARVAHGMGAEVTVLEQSGARIRELDHLFDRRARVLMSDELTLGSELQGADIVIGAVLVPGRRAPKLITREMLRAARPGGVFVDIAIDQGGCAESSRPTTHLDPTYVDQGVVHYCVTNMPGAVPATATHALTNATLPYVRLLARGIEEAVRIEPGLRAGINVRLGEIESAPLADELAASERLAAAGALD